MFKKYPNHYRTGSAGHPVFWWYHSVWNNNRVQTSARINRTAFCVGQPAGTTPDSVIRILNWNLGFGGLGAEMDFFYDGGHMVRAERSVWDKDFVGQLQTLKDNQPIDFYFLQEADIHSKRSYYVNMVDSIGRMLQKYSWTFGMNYYVQHVPLPITRPLGHRKRRGHLFTLSGAAT